MKRIAIALGIIFAWALITGGMDRRDAEITGQHERAVAQKKADVKPEEQVWMMLPIECRTWLAKCGAGQVCKPRFNCAADLTRRAER